MRRKSQIWKGVRLAAIVVLSALLQAGAGPSLATLPASPGTQAVPALTSGPKIASNLSLLLSLQTQALAPVAQSVRPDSSLGRELARIAASGQVEVSARFARELSAAERAGLEKLGVEFQTLPAGPGAVAGRLAGLGRFYGLLVPVGAIDELAAYPLSEWLEATWRPVVPAPLDLSITYNPGASTYGDAPGLWNVASPFTGLPLTGHGVTIANFDTGVDVRHPAFLNGTYGAGYNTWDTSGDGVLTPNVDQLGGATLRFWEAAGDPQNTAGILDLTQDWIFGDTNGNIAYDWNEPIYMAYDANADGTLQAAEYLINRGTLGPGLPTSRIAATLDGSAVQRTRGVDLEGTPADLFGHGTSVTGILGAGAAHWTTQYVWPSARRYTGLAPDANLLVADRVGLNNNFNIYVPWALGLGARIMLYEYGGWVQEYLDGSSNHEQMMDLLWSQGVLQVVPTGNLHCAGTGGCNPRHLHYSLPAAGAFTHQFNVPVTPAMGNVWASLLWLTPGNNLTVQLTTPTGGTGNTVALPCAVAGSGWQFSPPTSDGHVVGCERAANSSRGTALYNLWIYHSTTTVPTGNWTMTVNNPGASAEPTNFYIADDSTNAWAFGAGWLNTGLGQEKYTAVWPSTCDTCLGVASYATRANFIGVPGGLSWFSGRGPRFLDGARIVDVAAPGHYDVISPESQAVAGAVGAYNATFGGTSAAAPHVAGLAALLYQWANGATDAYHVGEAIMRSAWQDGFTGTVPNDNWGYGKINAPLAHVYMMHDLGDAPASANSAGANMDAYPGVQANFPTVYNAPVPGPLHWAAGSVAMGPWDSCLGVPTTGPTISAEGEADVLFDEEMVNNILPLASMADLDKPDDGLPFPGPVVPCGPLPLVVSAFLVPAPTQPPPWNRYVNVWFDWNTDGDWGDVHTCATPNDAPEWALQNWVAGAPGPVLIPFAPLAYQTNPGDPFWIRVSIAEQMPPPDPITLRPDGRGPAGGYAYGETEDYLYPQTSFQAAASTCISVTLSFTHDPASSWPVTFAWNFDDGTILTNPGANPSHQFTQIGPHTVTLTGTHTSGVFSVYTQTVQVQSCMAYVPIIRKP